MTATWQRPAPDPRRATVPGLPARGRTLVMGIVNTTSDSFSDGGDHLDPDRAAAHGLMLADLGADLIDVGGESTRPGALRVPANLERRRVVPVVRALADAGLTVSVDTMRASVAAAALSAGAAAVNDVSGGLADPLMAPLVAEARTPYIAMHWRTTSDRMHLHSTYDDVVADVVTELRRRLDSLLAAGIDLDQVLLDPGLGFAKRPDHNWQLLAHLDALQALGRPLVIGASRKSFLGDTVADGGPVPAPKDRDAASAAVSALAAVAGIYCVRVHDVRSSVHAIRVAAAWQGAASERPSSPTQR